ncbi:hypothetical protein AGMMS49940_19790 [Spirochaetia bacterium]|nr:hypothetical protein AGMMS49940_19790 [Spirochaetia bacterium]
MKKNKFSVLVMVLTFGFVLLGCVTADKPVSAEVPGVPKTIIITGFNLPVEGIREVNVELTGDWVDEQNAWIRPASGVAQLNGQTLIAELWTNGLTDTSWTGTGEYGIIVQIKPRTGKTVADYRYRFNMPGEHSLNIKDAETTLAWSDFVFGWEWEED